MPSPPPILNKQAYVTLVRYSYSLVIRLSTKRKRKCMRAQSVGTYNNKDEYPSEKRKMGPKALLYLLKVGQEDEYNPPYKYRGCLFVAFFRVCLVGVKIIFLENNFL